MLAVVMVLLVPLAGLAGALLTLGSQESVEQDATRARHRALHHAESGLDRALARLMNDADDLSPLVEMHDDGQHVRFRVEFEDLGADDVDNDGDGLTDETDEQDRIRMTSTGALNVLDFDADGTPVTAGGRFHVKTVRAVGSRLAGLPAFPYAVYLGDPLAELKFDGNAFKIDGNDYTKDGTLANLAAVPGIATVGDEDDVKAQITKQQKDNVHGAGGTPSVSNTAELDLAALIAQYKSAADIKFINPTQNFTGSLGDADSGDYAITYVLGNLKISGGATGAGLMLVDGNLEITGGFEYRGIMIVTGQVIFKGGGGGKRVIGTVLVGGDVIQSGQSSTDLQLSGTIDCYYSSSIQNEVGNAVSSFTLGAWQEL